MSMLKWAEQECRLACKKENPNFDFDSEQFDYGCSCYKSALKAYSSLCDDGHFGSSFSFTKNILIRLMEGIPLTPIKDEDFPKVEYDPNDEWLKEQKLKSDVQCPRMSSLFRKEHMDGSITYHDIDRAYYINVEEPSDTFSFSTKFLDEMFPITMPYMPKKEKYKIYCQTFLVDEKNGDFDTKGILYLITPDGKRVDVNIYMTEKNGKMTNISKEEYDQLLSRRIDTVSKKAARHLLWTLISNSADDKEIEVREKAYKSISNTQKEEMFKELTNMCKFFDNPEHYKYNTFHIGQLLCNGNTEELEGIPELIEISNWLQKQLKFIKQE